MMHPEDEVMQALCMVVDMRYDLPDIEGGPDEILAECKDFAKRLKRGEDPKIVGAEFHEWCMESFDMSPLEAW